MAVSSEGLSGEDDGPACMTENAVLCVCLDGAQKGCAFQVAAGLDHVGGGVGMVDGFGDLGDDRAFIQVCGDVMGGGANDLHAAGVSLMIGSGALEARQEGVVDVDAPSLQFPAGIVAEDLHVTREHDQVRAGFLNHVEEPRFSGWNVPVGMERRNHCVGLVDDGRAQLLQLLDPPWNLS